MPIGKSGKLVASAGCRSGNPGSRWLPRDADREVREAGGFREMPVGKSGKPVASARRRSGSPGSREIQIFLDVDPEKSGFCSNLARRINSARLLKSFIPLIHRA